MSSNKLPLLVTYFVSIFICQVRLDLLDLDSVLPETYDKMVPPKENGSATVVKFHVTVMSLDSIDEGSMTFAADIFFGQEWRDNRLRLPTNMSEEYRLLPVNWLKHFWRPDSIFRNAKSVTFQTMTIPNHYLWLYKNKNLLYMVKLTLLLSCTMQFRAYPHDTQVCTMKMESLSYTTDDLIFEWLPEEAFPLVVDNEFELPQHDLVKSEKGDCMKIYTTGNFSCLEVIFTLRRRLGYYLFHTYIPTCLIVVMSWISFWIKPEAVPARITLSVTSLLTLSTQHAQSQKALPPVSYVKAIDIFMSACTVFVFASLMEYAIVTIILGDAFLLEDEKKKVIKTVKLTPLSKDGDNIPDMIPPKCAMQTRLNRCRSHAILIDKISRFFFPASFLLLNLVYWTIHLETF